MKVMYLSEVRLSLDETVHLDVLCPLLLFGSIEMERIMLEQVACCILLAVCLKLQIVFNQPLGGRLVVLQGYCWEVWQA